MLKEPLVSSRKVFAGLVLCCLSLFAFSQQLVVKSVYFKTGSDALDKQYFYVLDEIARKCKSDTSFFMKIFAFTDTVGSERYNDGLAKRRAFRVYNYLAKRCRLRDSKVYITWLGETAEGYDLHFPDAHLQQRCVDIIANFKMRRK